MSGRERCRSLKLLALNVVPSGVLAKTWRAPCRGQMWGLLWWATGWTEALTPTHFVYDAASTAVGLSHRKQSHRLQRAQLA